MKKPEGYDELNIDYTALPAGGYVCKIMQVKEVDQRDFKFLEVSLDVAEGEYKDHFSKLYKNNSKKEKRWGCVKNVFVNEYKTDRTSRDFKRFCVYTEKSNPGFQVLWGSPFEACFKGQLIGVVFGREQFMGSNGPAWACKPCVFLPAEDIRQGKFEVPEDKKIEGAKTTEGHVENGFFFTESANTDDLPFM